MKSYALLGIILLRNALLSIFFRIRFIAYFDSVHRIILIKLCDRSEYKKYAKKKNVHPIFQNVQPDTHMVMGNGAISRHRNLDTSDCHLCNILGGRMLDS